MFKRTIREAALKHGIYATFMAKPMQAPGGFGHAHSPVGDRGEYRQAISFPIADGSASKEFFSFIGGMQKYVPKALVDDGALCELLSSPDAGHVGARSTMPGAMTTAQRRFACRFPNRSHGASKTGCQARTPIPIWRSQRRSAAAISAWCRVSNRRRRQKIPSTVARSTCRAACWRRSRFWNPNRAFADVFSAEFVGHLCRRQARANSKPSCR